MTIYIISSVQFSCSVVSDSLQPHESQHARPPIVLHVCYFIIKIFFHKKNMYIYSVSIQDIRQLTLACLCLNAMCSTSMCMYVCIHRHQDVFGATTVIGYSCTKTLRDSCGKSYIPRFPHGYSLFECTEQLTAGGEGQAVD